MPRNKAVMVIGACMQACRLLKRWRQGVAGFCVKELDAGKVGVFEFDADDAIPTFALSLQQALVRPSQ